MDMDTKTTLNENVIYICFRMKRGFELVPKCVPVSFGSSAFYLFSKVRIRVSFFSMNFSFIAEINKYLIISH